MVKKYNTLSVSKEITLVNFVEVQQGLIEEFSHIKTDQMLTLHSHFLLLVKKLVITDQRLKSLQDGKPR